MLVRGDAGRAGVDAPFERAEAANEGAVLEHVRLVLRTLASVGPRRTGKLLVLADASGRERQSDRGDEERGEAEHRV